MPVTADLGLRKIWAATIDYTPDHLPILGPGLDAGGAPIDGLTVASPGGHGMMWGPAVARVAADLVLHGRTDVTDVSDFGLDRFDAQGRSRLAPDPIALPFPLSASEPGDTTPPSGCRSRGRVTPAPCSGVLPQSPGRASGGTSQRRVPPPGSNGGSMSIRHERAFAHLERRAGQERGELAEVGVVAHDHRPGRIAGIVEHLLEDPDPERVGETGLIGDPHLERVRDGDGGLGGADLGARQDDVGLVADRGQPTGDARRLAMTLGREWPLGVGPRPPAGIARVGVAEEEQLDAVGAGGHRRIMPRRQTYGFRSSISPVARNTTSSAMFVTRSPIRSR